MKSLRNCMVFVLAGIFFIFAGCAGAPIMAKLANYSAELEINNYWDELESKAADYDKFPGQKERGACEWTIRSFMSRMQVFHGREDASDAYILAMYQRLVPAYKRFMEYRRCGLDGTRISYRFNEPDVERLLREHPGLRTAEFKAVLKNYLAQVRAIGGQGSWIDKAEKELERLIPDAK